MIDDERIRELFRRVDAKDTEGWLAFLAPDARFRFGNGPAVEGREAIRAAVEGLFASISGLRHEVAEVWLRPGAVMCRGEVTYERLDGSELTVPFAVVAELDGELIGEYHVYADASRLGSAP